MIDTYIFLSEHFNVFVYFYSTTKEVYTTRFQNTNMQNTWLYWKKIWMFQRTWWIISANCYLFMVPIKVFIVSLLGMIRCDSFPLYFLKILVFIQSCEVLLKIAKDFQNFIFLTYESLIILNYNWILNSKQITVKLANSGSPFKFHQVNFPQKTGLELLLWMIMCFL